MPDAACNSHRVTANPNYSVYPDPTRVRPAKSLSLTTFVASFGPELISEDIMAAKRINSSPNTGVDTGQTFERETIAANEVGLSLSLSDEALKGFERIQEETVRAAEKDQNFSWS